MNNVDANADADKKIVDELLNQAGGKRKGRSLPPNCLREERKRCGNADHETGEASSSADPQGFTVRAAESNN